jgi:hypothetical protein
LDDLKTLRLSLTACREYFTRQPRLPHTTPQSTNRQINKSSNTFGRANLKKKSKKPAGGFGLFIEAA